MQNFFHFKIFVGFFVDICRHLSEGCQTFFAEFVGNPMFPYVLIYVQLFCFNSFNKKYITNSTGMNIQLFT